MLYELLVINPFMWVLYFFAIFIILGYIDEYKKKQKK